ncbi:hypothetical protein [Pollutimonas bauzanensis]|nr:hypothetical protein [Pollutimonas bauzanensis]
MAAPLAQANADYPSRPIRLIVPFPAGSATGAMARAPAPIAALLNKVFTQELPSRHEYR